MKIAFDVDNVLADSMTCWCRKATNYLGRQVTKEEIKSHKIVGSVPIPAREIFRLQDQVWVEWQDLPTTEEDLSRKLGALRKNGFQIFIVTSRPRRSIDFVREWLSMNEIPFDEFHSIGPYASKTKIDTDALVDDAPEHIQQFVETGKTGFLYEQPWNRSAKIECAVTVESVSDVLSFYGISE